MATSSRKGRREGKWGEEGARCSRARLTCLRLRLRLRLHLRLRLRLRLRAPWRVPLFPLGGISSVSCSNGALVRSRTSLPPANLSCRPTRPIIPPPNRPLGVVSLATWRSRADVPRLESRQRRSLSSDGIHKGQEPFLRDTPLIRRYRRAPSR